MRLSKWQNVHFLGLTNMKANGVISEGYKNFVDIIDLILFNFINWLPVTG